MSTVELIGEVIMFVSKALIALVVIGFLLKGCAMAIGA